MSGVELVPGKNIRWKIWDFTINLSLLYDSVIWRPSENTSGRDVSLDFLAEYYISNESVNVNSTKELTFPFMCVMYDLNDYAETGMGCRETIRFWV